MAYTRLIKLADTSGGEGTSNWQYIWNIPTYRSFGGTINTPVTPTPLPEEDEKNNVLIKIEGNSATNRIMYVQENGSNEIITHGSGATLTADASAKPVGIWTILNAVINHFKPVSINDSYLFQVIGDASLPQIGRVSTSNPLYSVRGTFVKMEWSMASPVAMRWNLDFIEGNVTASFDFEPPLTPQANISGGAGRIIITSANRNSNDSGDSYDALAIEYTSLTGSPRTHIHRPSQEFSSIVAPITLTGISSGVYAVRVAFMRSGTAGAFSYPITVTVT